METILLKILEVQNEILAELRQLRQAVCQSAPLGAAGQPARPDASAPATAYAPADNATAYAPPPSPASAGSMPSASATSASPPSSPASEPAWSLASTSPAPASALAAPSAAAPEQTAAPAHQPGGRVTANELAAFGGQFLDAATMARGKVKSVDASDLSLSILDDIKAKNKAKRSAFAEFEKFDKYGRDR